MNYKKLQGLNNSLIKIVNKHYINILTFNLFILIV